MAEDKRVRISADLTPLRQLREEAISLFSRKFPFIYF